MKRILFLMNSYSLLGDISMARMKDKNKRDMILQSSKMLFSQKGFFHTSISDIVKETGLPVGSIYTYFKSKDEIVKVIVEEGWEDLYKRLEKALLSQISSEDKLKVLVEHFIPEVLNDLDLINILLSEAIVYTKIEEKIEKLTDLTFFLLKSIPSKAGAFENFDKTTMKTALMVYFLGILNTIKISRLTLTGLTESDVMKFIKITIENSLYVKFEK